MRRNSLTYVVVPHSRDIMMLRIHPRLPSFKPIAVALYLATSFTCATAQTLPAQVSTRYDVIVQQNLSVFMRDGTRLALDLYLPAQDGKPLAGKLPTLLARTPYNKNGGATDARWFAARGYAVVINDVRGRFAS